MRMGGRNRFSIKERDREKRERVRSGRIVKKEGERGEGSKYLTRCELEVVEE